MTDDIDHHDRAMYVIGYLAVALSGAIVGGLMTTAVMWIR